MRVRSLIPVLFGLVLLFPGSASAWHQHGHMAVARIAWKQLTDKQKINLSLILKEHPHHDIFLKAKRPVGMPEIEWVFVRAATWPDWVRNPIATDLDDDDKQAIRAKYDNPNWHFVNLPIIHPKDAGAFDAEAIRKTVLFPELDKKGEPRNALVALKQCVDILHKAETSNEDKAVQLCWLLHLIGDLHQPLHASALISNETTFGKFKAPKGDQGGNLIAIKVNKEDKSAKKLHAYWDTLLFEDQPPFKRVDSTVVGLIKQLPPSEFKTELKETDFLAWAEESLELAKTVVYKGDGEDGFLKCLPLPPNKHVELKGLDATALPAGYHDKAEEVAGRRMVLAGYRLAMQMKSVVPSK